MHGLAHTLVTLHFGHREDLWLQLHKENRVGKIVSHTITLLEIIFSGFPRRMQTCARIVSECVGQQGRINPKHPFCKSLHILRSQPTKMNNFNIFIIDP